ncbi:MAG: hypothetical protein GY938_04160 [Ketobacter sp.]|nr:hypothetical protein [Ketobacter sp.]
MLDLYARNGYGLKILVQENVHPSYAPTIIAEIKESGFTPVVDRKKANAFASLFRSFQ